MQLSCKTEVHLGPDDRNDDIIIVEDSLKCNGEVNIARAEGARNSIDAAGINVGCCRNSVLSCGPSAVNDARRLAHGLLPELLRPQSAGLLWLMSS